MEQDIKFETQEEIIKDNQSSEEKIEDAIFEDLFCVSASSMSTRT